MARKLQVEIVGDSRSLERAFNRSSSATGGFGRSFGRIAKGVAATAAVAAVAITAGFVGTLNRGFDELAEGQKVTAQTAAVLKSTGGVANVTAQDVEKLAGSLSAVSGIDDELIQKSENLLLTFKNVRNEVGEGNKVFDRATAAAADLSVAGFGALESTSKMLGKALNDPVRGMTALGRAGVTFTDAQKKTIKALAESGQAMKAQKTILKEVESQVGGSAKAYGETFPGQLAKLRNAFDETAGNLAARFLPALTSALGFVNDRLLPAFDRAADAVGAFWTDISSRFSNAQGFKAKINVVWEGVQEIAQSIADEVSAALPNVDWTRVGQAIVNGIVPAIKTSVGLAQALAQLISDTFDKVDWVQVGRKAGPFLAAMVASAFVTLTDPAFWVHNWDLALAIALVAFGRGIGRFAGAALLSAGRVLRGLGEDLLLAVASGIARFAPRLGSAFLTAALFGARVLAGGLRRIWGVVEGAASAVWARMGPLLRTILTAGWIAGLASAISALGSAIASAASRVYGWAKSLGAALVDGVLDGISSLPGRLKDKIVGGIMGAIDAAKSAAGVSSPSTVTRDQLGKPLAEGVLAGWLLGSAALPGKMKESVQSAIEAARTAISEKRGALGEAFSALASEALAAFDKLSADIETRTERKMRLQDERRAAADRQRSLRDAQAALAEARAAAAAFGSLSPGQAKPEGWDEAAKALADAEQQLADARFAIQRVADEKRAARERKQLDDRRALQRRHFEEELAAHAAQATRTGMSAEASNQRLIKIFNKYRVPFRNAANDLGMALAEGLRDAWDDVEHWAEALRDEIVKKLSSIRVTINVNVKQSGGPPPERQHGGPVWPGQAFLVGESGPELFVPPGHGRILNAGTTRRALTGEGSPLSGGITFHIQELHVREDDDVERIASAVMRRLAFA